MASFHLDFLALLACPVVECRGPLTLTDAALVCAQCGRSYRIEQSWPVLIPDEATPAGTSGSISGSPPSHDRGTVTPGGTAT